MSAEAPLDLEGLRPLHEAIPEMSWLISGDLSGGAYGILGTNGWWLRQSWNKGGANKGRNDDLLRCGVAIWRSKRCQ